MLGADSLRLYTNAADFKEGDRKTLENAGVEVFLNTMVFMRMWQN